MIDINRAKCVSVEIRDDGKVLWVNTEEGCQLRICQIEHIKVVDARKGGGDGDGNLSRSAPQSL